MTFEEFFLKKKIDLDLLALGKPELLNEFKDHYEQMSEKSFDHTKKYWFNNLRISYPLSEEKEQAIKAALKPKEHLPEATNQHLSTDATSKPITKSPGFKPRFKAPAGTETKSTEIEPLENKIQEPVSNTPKPAGFKPRFKPGMASGTPKIPEEQVAQSEVSESKQPPSDAKPAGFKPRFKAGKTTTAVNETEQKDISQQEEKPLVEQPATAKLAGFKPRFKAGKTTIVAKTGEENASETPKQQDEAENPPAESKPIGFKPRFKVPKKED